MGEIHSFSDGSKLAVWEERNQIRAFSFPVRRGTGPSVLRQDLLRDLTSAVYRGRIYYAYHSLEHRVLVCSVGVQEAAAVLSDPTDSCQYCGLRLLVWKDELRLLFCARSQTEKSWSVRVMSPLKNPEQAVLWEGIREKPEPVFAPGKALLILIGREARIWNGEGAADKGEILSARVGAEARRTILALWDEVRACRKEADAQKQWYEERLGQAERQYRELAEFAEELRTEGKKWREKYYRKQR